MIKTLYLVHHSHTDIGYNHDQPVIWELHRRYLSDAVELAWTDRDRGDDAAFRWSVETTTPLRYWLDHATPEARERLRTLNASGRVAVGCMALNITPLYDTAELIESLRPVHTLRETYGFNIRYGLNCDVNGQNWPLVDVLLDAGIEGFGMAINEHLGGAPFAAPNPFWWEGPSGRRILAWNGWIYGYMARHSGVGKDAAVFEEWLARVERYLQGTGYSLPILLLQVAGDNQPVRRDLAPFVNAWNAAGKAPRLRLSNLDEWFDALKAHGDEIPTCRGDWTDYWNFGSISSAREVAFNRESRTRLIAADGLHAQPRVQRVVGRARRRRQRLR